MNRNASKLDVRLENLEKRTMLAGNPLTLVVTGSELRITGTNGADQIVVTPISGGLAVSNGDWSATRTGTFTDIWINAADGDDAVTIDPAIALRSEIYGGAGNDTLIGGSSRDEIYGGAGRNRIEGRGGDDTLVSIGVGAASIDTLVGGDGFDAFWVDSAKTETITDISQFETARGAVHRVENFYTVTNGKASTKTALKASVAEIIADPKVTGTNITYKNFGTRELFADAGPTLTDIEQGGVGDCYFLATLGSLAKVDANAIRQSIVDLGDGTYVVQFTRGSQKIFVRVDADLPTYSSGQLAYAGLGAEGSIWAPVMEKAYAVFRQAKGTYASISGGWMQDVYRDLGLKGKSVTSAKSDAALMTLIQNELSAGKFVTFGVGKVSKNAPVIGNHAYVVINMTYDSAGKANGVRLWNPWGVDGVGNDGANDGYVTLSATQARAVFMGMVSATY